MADALLSALLRMVMEKATNHALRQLRSMRDIHKKLEELERKLLAIQDMIGDAEERQVRDNGVKRWLEVLKETAYEADDILDEFNVEVMRRKAGNQADMTKKVRSFFSSYNPILFRLQIGRKLNGIIEKINEIITEGEKFHFNKATIQPQNRNRPQTYSYVDESTVIGREEDKEKIVKLLLDHDDNQNVAVLPIVGMGGLGKTTLAQLIYKDERVENHFQPLIWVCVSDEFEVVKLAKAIITSATKNECAETTMELLQHRLREVLSGKRYFLVLDDVWNDDWEKWDGLKTLLETGKEGSKIIVTTRSEQAASMMGTIPPHYPQHLNENDSWTLFKRRAFKDIAEEPQNLVSIGKDIVKKCDGLPLAVNSLGALMHSKSQEAEWLSVKDSEIWNLPVADKIFSVLRLSYGELPSHLKQCFAFCAIFPKDHVMEKEMLIELWMANGFIPSDEGKELQDKGNEIFNELAWRSFFQDIKKVGKDEMYRRWDKFYGKTTCRMHDLMHDLAQSIMGNECLSSVQHDRWEHVSKKTRHLYVPPNFRSGTQRTLNNFSNIRTLLTRNWRSGLVVAGDSLKSMPLRALELTPGRDGMQLLNAIRFLKYLRYLDLFSNTIKVLPEAVSTLFNLQTLKLDCFHLRKLPGGMKNMSNLQTLKLRCWNLRKLPDGMKNMSNLQTLTLDCWNLRKLPDGMKNMRNLRHLYIDGCGSLKCLPASMGQLRSLRTLTNYIVGNENGGGIDELNGLNLGGQLEIYNLRNVKNAADAKKADLNFKHNLCSLILCWDMIHWYPDHCDEKDLASIENAEEVLEGLRPHVGLKLLTIFCYGGTSFPTWMKDSQLLQNLVEIHLEVCTGCEHLPPLWQSRSLKFLFLKKMDKVKYICSGNESNGTVQAFSSLERLVLYKMQSLKAWSEDEGTAEATLVFPRLAVLKIVGCPNLMNMPKLPSLADFKMTGTVFQLGLMSSLSMLSSLSIIYKTSTETRSPSFSQKTMSFRYFKSFTNLIIGIKKENLVSHLKREETEGLLRWNEPIGLSKSLHFSMIRDCNELFSLSQQASSPLGFWKNLASLKYLQIVNCDELVYLPEEIRGLNSLENLNILMCNNLIGLSPSPLSFLSSRDEELLSNLKILWIQSCKGLLELPKLPASLRTLSVSDCANLSSLTESLQHTSALETIYISHCESLASLPVDLGHLTALQSLIIKGCPKLERLCKRGGPYWELVSQIPQFEIIPERSTSNTINPSVRYIRRASTV